MTPRLSASLAPAFLVVTLLAACGSNGTSGPTSASPTSSGLGGTVHVMLQHQPRGEAKLALAGNKLTVTVTLSGLAPNSVHPAHIHGMGNCSSNSPVIHPLSNVVADATGSANVTSTVNGVTSIPATGWYVNVHNGPTLNPQD